MKAQALFLNAVLIVAFVAALTSSIAQSAAAPTLESRLAKEWIASATRVRAGALSVFYRGSARPSEQSSQQQWQGTIKGDILVLSPTTATVCTEATVELGPGGRLSIIGPHRAHVAEPKKARWRHLLRE